MLGITVPDAIAFGVFALSVAAFIYGRKSGDAAARVKPVDPATSGIAAGFVDKDLMTRLTMATEDIAKTLKTYLDIQTDKHEQKVEELLKQIHGKLSKPGEEQ